MARRPRKTIPAASNPATAQAYSWTESALSEKPIDAPMTLALAAISTLANGVVSRCRVTKSLGRDPGEQVRTGRVGRPTRIAVGIAGVGGVDVLGHSPSSCQFSGAGAITLHLRPASSILHHISRQADQLRNPERAADWPSRPNGGDNIGRVHPR